MFRTLVVLLTLTVASAASATWHPSIDPTSVRVQVGQTQTVSVRAIWTGLMVIPWNPWIFTSDNPSIATVEGRMDDSRPGEMRITGVNPGHAVAGIQGVSSYYNVDVTVVCGPEDPIVAADAEQRVATGATVVLRALTPIAKRTTFTWYMGHTADTSRPISASGPEIPFVTDDIGTQYAWVMATTPCSASTAEFRIDAHAPRRRAVR